MASLLASTSALASSAVQNFAVQIVRVVIEAMSHGWRVDDWI